MDIYSVYKRRPDVRVFLEIVLSLATITFFATFALRPTTLTISDLLKQIESKREIIAKLDQKIEDLGVARTAFDAEGTNITILDSAIPSDPTPETFARQLEGLARVYGIVLNSIIVDEVTLVGEETAAKPKDTAIKAFPEGTGEVSFSVNAVGEYEQLSSFLQDLQNLRRPAILDQSSISITESETGRTLSLVVTGRIPYLGE